MLIIKSKDKQDRREKEKTSFKKMPKHQTTKYYTVDPNSSRHQLTLPCPMLILILIVLPVIRLMPPSKDDILFVAEDAEAVGLFEPPLYPKI